MLLHSRLSDTIFVRKPCSWYPEDYEFGRIVSSIDSTRAEKIEACDISHHLPLHSVDYYVRTLLMTHG